MNVKSISGRVLNALATALLTSSGPSIVFAGTLFEDRYVLLESVTNCRPPGPCSGGTGSMGLVYVPPGGLSGLMYIGGRGSTMAADVMLTDTELSVVFWENGYIEDHMPAFNGIQIRSMSATMPDIGSVQLLRSSIPLFTEQAKDRIAFTTQLAMFDFGGLYVNGGDELHFAFNSPVPEPSPGAMLAAGLCALGWLDRRRRRADNRACARA